MTSDNTKAEREPDYDAEKRLPEGKTCADCVHALDCDALFGAVRRGFTSCDFWPSRYRAALPPGEPDAAAVERVARAIYEGHWGPVADAVWPDLWEREKNLTYLEKQARAALAAMPAAQSRDEVIEQCWDIFAAWSVDDRESVEDLRYRILRLKSSPPEKVTAPTPPDDPIPQLDYEAAATARGAVLPPPQHQTGEDIDRICGIDPKPFAPLMDATPPVASDLRPLTQNLWRALRQSRYEDCAEVIEQHLTRIVTAVRAEAESAAEGWRRDYEDTKTCLDDERRIFAEKLAAAESAPTWDDAVKALREPIPLTEQFYAMLLADEDEGGWAELNPRDRLAWRERARKDLAKIADYLAANKPMAK